MIKFLLKGVLGDKNRSLLPIIIISIGVALTVLLSGYIRGAMGDIINQNARFDTGHVKIMTRAYAENKSQIPNDLAFLGVDSLINELRISHSNMTWVKRIRFGGIIDIPDDKGETKGQGPASGMAIELFNTNSGEIQRMNILSSLVQGTLPKQAGEALIGQEFVDKLGLKIGDKVTYFGSTMNGSMAFKNFTITGSVRFGTPALDKGAIIIDISDAQTMLDMEDGAGEILGFESDEIYDDEKALALTKMFNTKFANNTDEFAPVMLRLKDQNNLAGYLDYVDVYSAMFVTIFVIVMSIVLWNTGLLGGLRRYQEFGIRLALGESKGHIYRTLIYEATLIGIIGSIVGTAIGLGGTYYLQLVGIDIGKYLENATMLMPSVIRAQVTPELFYIGFIPGLFAMVFGTMLSGIGIYKRQTAALFKELEV
ncbi:MAG: FtsX-like permease family protein [Maribacter sp.]|nr:FtsX-like permease family protein [Maribacter sp.]